MIYISNITIKDSGYVSVVTSGTVFSGTDIVNSGTAVEIKGVSITYERAANVDDNKGPIDTNTPVNSVSSNNPKISITGIVKRGDKNGTGTDLATLPYLDAMCVTKGIKCVYYNDSVADTTGYPLLTKFLGVTDSYGNHPTEKHLHVRFERFRITQSADSNSYTFNLEGVVTG